MVKHIYLLIFACCFGFQAFAQPPNDNCANAIQLNNLENHCYTNEDFNGATFDIADGSCNPNYVNPPNTWYRFTALHNEVEMSAVSGGNRFKITLIEFAPGNECGAVTFLACSEGLLNYTNLVVGNQYYIIISRDPTLPSFTLCIDNSVPIVPANNEPCDAIILTNNVQSCGSNLNASGTFDPNGLPCPTLSGADVWYRFTVTAPNNTITFTFSGVTINGNGQVLLGQWSNGCSGTYTFRTPAFCGPLNNVVYSCLSPGTYYMMVSSAVQNAGEFCVTATQTGPPAGCAGNDACASAVNVATPPVGGQTCVSGCNTGACGESNLNFQGCRLDLLATVWHTFTTGPQSNLLYNLTISGGSHTISLFTGGCGNLTGLFLCQPAINSVVLAPNTTYYVAIATQYQNSGTYTFCIETFENPSICSISTSVEVMGTSYGSPPNGPYQQGEIVSFCLRVDDWDASQNNCQWLHGIVPLFGNGWDISSFDPSGEPNMNQSGPDPVHMNEGYWDWYTGVVYNTVVNPATATRRIYTDAYGNIRICSIFEPGCDPGYPILTAGATLPGGWFVCRQAASQGPCPLNWGDGASCGPGHGPWSVCFDLKAKEFDEEVICEELSPDDVDCSVKFYTMADGETGSWSAFDCAGDIPAIHNAIVNCCTRPIGEEDVDLICSGNSSDISLTANQNPVSFTWTVTAPPGVIGASAGSGSGIYQTLVNTTPFTQRVTYIITPVNESTECVGRPFEVYVDVLPQVQIDIETDPEDKVGCASTPFELTANPSGGSGGGFTYLWSSGEPNDGPSIIVTPGVQGRYTYYITVTDENGCTEVAQETVEIFPKIYAELEIETTEFCEEYAPKILSVITDPSTIVSTYTWINPGPPTPNNRSFISVNQSGLYQVTITDINGCTGDDELEITVNPTPEIYVLTTPPDTICVDADMDDEDFIDFSLIWLDFSQDQTFAEWAGTAQPVLGGRVYPKSLYDAYGPGTYNIQLILESIFGCIDSIYHEFEIIGPPDLTLSQPSAFCATASPYVLQGIPTGGSWSGPGVNNNLFDPQVVGAGSYTLYYEFLQSTCRAVDSIIVVVNPPPVVNLTAVQPLCFNSPEIQLSASPTGGAWTGNGITNPSGIFDPSDSGSGLHSVTYTYQEGVCSFPYQLDILVHPEIVSDFTVDPLICLTDSSETTFSGVAPQNSLFTWDIPDGVITQNDDRGNITVKWNTSGSKTLSLLLNIDGCIDGPFLRNVEVEQPLENPVPTCDSLSTTSVHFSWDGITRAIGYEITYNNTVDTITATQFSVENIIAGSTTDVTITVVALGNGVCGNSLPITITCTSLPCPNIQLVPEDDDIDLCIYQTGAPTQLNVDVINSDGSGVGVWTGQGVNSNGMFDPRIPGEGTHLVTYTFTEQSCPYNANIVIRAYVPSVASWESDKYLVCLEDIVEIEFNGVLRRTGTAIWDFDGAEIVSGADFGPYILRWDTPGIKNISLKIEDAFCESEVFSRTIEVEAPLMVPQITCESNPVSVRFYWDPVPNATGYVIVINNGSPIQLTSIDTSYLVGGLNQGDLVTITIYAEGSGICGNSLEVDFDCEAKECPIINVSIDQVNQICLDGNVNPIPLDLTINGSNQTGSGVWFGTGIDQNGIFDPVLAGAGAHFIEYRFTEEFCNYFANITINVFDLPVADFDLSGPICTEDQIQLDFNGTLIPGSSYNWSVDGGQIINGDGTASIEVQWGNAGSKTVTLVVTENGCPSVPLSKIIEVESPLLAPILDCDPSTTEILFRWLSVPGAESYDVVINGNPVFNTTDLQQLIDGLTVGQQVTISITPINSGPCGNGPTTTLICEAEPCPLIQVAIQNEDFICLSPSTSTQLLSVSVTGEVVNGTGFWIGDGIVDNQTGLFDPLNAGVGTHEIVYSFREKGCNYFDTIYIDIKPQPEVDFMVNSPVCIDQIADVQFTGTATGSAVFNWALDGATILSGAGTSQMEVSWSTPGLKNLTLNVDDNGCIASEISRQVIVERPIADPVIRCNSTLTSVSFTWNPVVNSEGYLVTINGGTPFVWNSTTYDLPDMVTGDSVTIVVIAINSGPCGNSNPDQLTCYAADCKDVILQIDPIIPICLYDVTTPYLLKANATNGYGGGTFTWSGSGITDSEKGIFDPRLAGIGQHEITLIYKETVCPYIETVFLDVVSVPEFVFEFISPICYGIPDGSINIIDVSDGESPYMYALGNTPFGTDPIFNGLSHGLYTISVRDANQCIVTEQVQLVQPDKLIVNLGPDLLVDAGDVLTLTPEFNVPTNEIADYLWSGSEEIDCITCPQINVILFDQTRIYIEVEDERGCKATDDVNVVVRKKRRVFVPSSFTPDNDGINDYFTVFAAEEVVEVELFQVFDRWGEKLFVNENFLPNDESEGWNGTLGGQMLNPGVFIYHIRVKFQDGTTGDYHGDVTLLKN